MSNVFFCLQFIIQTGEIVEALQQNVASSMRTVQYFKLKSVSREATLAKRRKYAISTVGG